MNRKERRQFEKFVEKEKSKFIRKNVQSIYEVLNTTEDLIRKDSEDIIQVSLPRNIEESIQKCTKSIEQFNQILPGIREIFLCDQKCNNGFIRKSVINALEMPKYREKLNEVVDRTIKNQNNGAVGTFNYIMWHDLSANATEVRRTLYVLAAALPVIITNLKSNNIRKIEYLIQQVTILERRLYQLYSLYGYYLEDIGNSAEYFIISNAFEEIDSAIKSLYSIKKKLN